MGHLPMGKLCLPFHIRHKPVETFTNAHGPIPPIAPREHVTYKIEITQIIVVKTVTKLLHLSLEL